MKVLSEWIKNIVLVLVLSTFLELLLPSSKMKSYIKVILGLFFVLVIIQPVWQLLGLADYRLFLPETVDSFLADADPTGREIEKENRRLALEHYGRVLAQQVESIARAVPEIERAFAQVTINEAGEIKNLWLRVHRQGQEKKIKIEQIIIDSSLQEAEEKKEAIIDDLQMTLAQLYRLELGDIEIEVFD